MIRLAIADELQWLLARRPESLFRVKKIYSRGGMRSIPNFLCNADNDARKTWRDPVDEKPPAGFTDSGH